MTRRKKRMKSRVVKSLVVAGLLAFFSVDSVSRLLNFKVEGSEFVFLFFSNLLCSGIITGIITYYFVKHRLKWTGWMSEVSGL